ncbi:MAG: ATP-binding cassette domain-containing protein [Oscillospiraceae bacterium]|nr:ATP-binding cassette domain-containing protein [Oscillospiraceae bacterium]
MAEIMVRVENASFRYPNAKEYNLKNINFEVEKGEFLVIMGENGAGKTTLCKVLSGIIPHSQEGSYFGDVTICGLNSKEHALSTLTQHIGIVLDDPESQLFTTEVLDEVAFGAENLELPVDEIRRNAQWAIDVVRMQGYEEKDPTRLSGGQKQRVAIASALTMQPEILILDEPTSQLDPIGTLEVFQVVRELKETYHMTIIMVTHKSEEIAQFADRVLVLHAGEVLAQGTPQEIFRNQEVLDKAWLAIPQASEVCVALEQQGIALNGFPVVLEEGVQQIGQLLNGARKEMGA